MFLLTGLQEVGGGWYLCYPPWEVPNLFFFLRKIKKYVVSPAVEMSQAVPHSLGWLQTPPPYVRALAASGILWAVSPGPSVCQDLPWGPVPAHLRVACPLPTPDSTCGEPVS